MNSGKHKHSDHSNFVSNTSLAGWFSCCRLNTWLRAGTQWTWVSINSGSWWWTGRPGVLWFMGSQRVGHDWASELNWRAGKKKEYTEKCCFFKGEYEVWVQVSQFKERDSEGHSGSETVVLFHVHLLKQWPLGSGPKYKMGWKYKYLPPSKKSSYPDTRLGNMR